VVRFPAQAKHYSLRQNVKTDSGVRSAYYSGGTGRQITETDRSPLTTAEIRMRGATLPPHAIMTHTQELYQTCANVIYISLRT
jgi:hypothetical protein